MEKAKAEIISTGFKEVSKMFDYLIYESADLKTLLFDISSSVRGIGGVKTTFNPKDLPSNNRDKKLKEEEMKAVENETPEEREERHRKFFEELKAAFKK